MLKILSCSPFNFRIFWLLTYCKSRIAKLFQTAMPLDITQLHQIGQQTQCIISFESVKHNPHGLLGGKQFEAFRKYAMADQAAYTLKVPTINKVNLFSFGFVPRGWRFASARPERARKGCVWGTCWWTSRWNRRLLGGEELRSRWLIRRHVWRQFWTDPDLLEEVSKKALLRRKRLLVLFNNEKKSCRKRTVVVIERWQRRLK